MKEFRSRTEIKKEGKQLEEERRVSTEAAARDVGDQERIVETGRQLRGGTAEGLAAARQHITDASSSLQADFERNHERSEKVNESLAKSADIQSSLRDDSYHDARAADDVVRQIELQEARSSLKEMRDTAAEEAAFFEEQRQRRVLLSREGKRINNELKSQMQGLTQPSASLGRKSLDALLDGMARGGDAVPPHKDGQAGLDYQESFDSSLLGRSGMEVRNAREDKKAGAKGHPHYDVIEKTPDGDHLHHRVSKPE